MDCITQTNKGQKVKNIKEKKKCFPAWRFPFRSPRNPAALWLLLMFYFQLVMGCLIDDEIMRFLQILGCCLASLTLRCGRSKAKPVVYGSQRIQSWQYLKYFPCKFIFSYDFLHLISVLMY